MSFATSRMFVRVLAMTLGGLYGLSAQAENAPPPDALAEPMEVAEASPRADMLTVAATEPVSDPLRTRFIIGLERKVDFQVFSFDDRPARLVIPVPKGALASQTAVRHDRLGSSIRASIWFPHASTEIPLREMKIYSEQYDVVLSLLHLPQL